MKKALNITLLILVVLLIGTGVTSFGGILPAQAILFFSLAVIAVAVWGLKWLVCRPVSWVWSPIHLPVLLFFAYTFARYLQSPIEHDSRVDLFHVGLYTGIYLLVAQNFYRTRDRRTIIIALVLLAVLESAYSLWQYRTVSDQVLWFDRGPDYHGRGSGTYFCPNHLAGFLAMVLGLLGARLIAASPPSETLQDAVVRRIFGLGGMALIGLGLYTTLSRGGWFAAILASLVMLVIAEATRVMTSRVAIRIFAAGVLLAAILASLPAIRSRVDAGVNLNLQSRWDQHFINLQDGLTGRFPMWQATLSLIHDHPLLGSGPATWQWFQLQYRLPASQIHPQYAHNDVLQLFAEYGVIGATLIIALFAAFYWQAFRIARQSESFEPRVFCVGAMAAVTAILIHSFVDFNLHIPANTLVVATLVGLVAAQGHVGETAARAQVPHFTRLTFGGIILAFAAIGAMVGLSMSIASRVAEQADRSAQAYNWDEALRLDHKALRFDPRSPDIYAQIGDIYRTQSALATNEDLQSARRLIAGQAVGEYQHALDLNPFQTEIILKMAAACELNGDNPSALRWYERLEQIDPNSAYNWVCIGNFYHRQGDTTHATAAWKHARELGGSNGYVASLLQGIDQPAHP